MFGRRNPVGDFNTQGQTKCGDCGDYYPTGWGTHGRSCTNPPADTSAPEKEEK